MQTTEQRAIIFLNKLIAEKGKEEAIKTIRYNLTGKNPYYRYNNIFDQYLASLINNL